MSKTIVLAVDTARHELGEHVLAAVEMVKEVAHTDDKVIVLHVHEFALGRFGRIQVDCAEGQGEHLVAEIVESLGQAGLSAEGVIREADFGHVARKIVSEADRSDARMLVLGSSTRTDLPWVPFGSVSNRLLHIASLPVLIVPMHRRRAAEPAEMEESAAVSDVGRTAQVGTT